jgi:hypothetical protein
MSGTVAEKTYIVHLCNMRNGVYDSYESTHLKAFDVTDAIRKATEWRILHASIIEESTRLQIMLDGTVVHTEQLDSL